jgi:hypothetical protein
MPRSNVDSSLIVSERHLALKNDDEFEFLECAFAHRVRITPVVSSTRNYFEPEAQGYLPMVHGHYHRGDKSSRLVLLKGIEVISAKAVTTEATFRRKIAIELATRGSVRPVTLPAQLHHLSTTRK